MLMITLNLRSDDKVTLMKNNVFISIPPVMF